MKIYDFEKENRPSVHDRMNAIEDRLEIMTVYMEALREGLAWLQMKESEDVTIN